MMIECRECNKKIKIPKKEDEIKGLAHSFHMLQEHRLKELAPKSVFMKCQFCNEKIYYWLEKGGNKKDKDKEVIIQHIKTEH